MISLTQVEEVVESEQVVGQPYAAEVFAGDGQAVSLLRLQVSRIAPHFRTALVTGERGAGKETVAREMHRLSSASQGPFSQMDVGSFAQEIGRVELSGLLYLYGLESLEPRLQERLALRLKHIQRETRIVFGSECDLRGMLATGRLRQSLSTRVGALEIRIASLRDRMEDFDDLARAMLGRQTTLAVLGLDVLRAMSLHNWPGNLAELWKTATHVSRVAGEISSQDLPVLMPLDESSNTAARLDKVMQRHVRDVLQRCSGNKLRAAELLGISRSTLYRMLEASGDSAIG
jgi:two-component system response regulator HydG